ncbi:hypothetical protein Tco_1383494 [Tanacetum coccineum]
MIGNDAYGFRFAISGDPDLNRTAIGNDRTRSEIAKGLVIPTVHMDRMSGASTVPYTFVMDRGITWKAASTSLSEKQKDESGSTANGFYESKREWQ